MRLPRAQSRRRLLRAGLGIILLAGLVGGGIWWRQQRQYAAKYTGPVENVSTGLIGEYAALVLIAQDQGFFRDNGLNVAITEYDSGPSAIADMLSGKLDTAMGADFAGVRNSFNGEDLKILATLSKAEAFFIVANRDRGISRISDLKGKRIGITRKTVGEFFLGQFLIFNQLSISDVTIVDLPPNELLEAQESGRIDAAVLFEPNAYKATSQLGDRAVQWSVQSGQPIYTALYSTGQFTRQRPETIVRYLRAVVAAENFLKQHNAQAKAIVARQLRYDSDYINYIWPKFSFEASLDQELLLNMDGEASWAIENHLTKATKPPNYLRMLHMEGLRAVKPEGITVIH